MKVFILAMALVSISIIPISNSSQEVNTLAVRKSIPVDDEGPTKPPAGGKDRKKPICFNGVCLG